MMSETKTVSTNSFQNQLLNSGNHRESVKAFNDYFSLTMRKAGLVFLEEILENFSTLPYENISKIIKLSETWDAENDRVRLPYEVIEGHMAQKLGGTCFSLTFFLREILIDSGFICYPVMADMRAGRNIHCCLVVVLDGVRYLVDPGYLLTRPMEINPAKPKLFRNEFAGVHLNFDDQTGWYHLYTFNKDKTTWRYRFQNIAVSDHEFLQHWQASFNWNSMHNICLTRVSKDGLIYIRKKFMRETTFNGKTNYNIRKTYHQTIHKTFGIDKQLVEQAEAALECNLTKKKELGLWVPKS